MMHPNLGGSITNDAWISEEEMSDPKELPHVPGFHVLVRPVSAKKQTKGGIIIPDKLQSDISYLTTVGRVLKTGDLSYRDESKFPNGAWCKEGDFVCYGKLTGTKFVYQGVKMLLIYDDQVLMTIKDPSVLDTSINLVA
jgi:co-chaperonin GroES (HSP10)